MNAESNTICPVVEMTFWLLYLAAPFSSASNSFRTRIIPLSEHALLFAWKWISTQLNWTNESNETGECYGYDHSLIICIYSVIKQTNLARAYTTSLPVMLNVVDALPTIIMTFNISQLIAGPDLKILTRVYGFTAVSWSKLTTKRCRAIKGLTI